MKYIIAVLVSMVMTVILSCSQSEQKDVKSKKIIDVAGGVGGGRITDISEVAKEIRYIPLETSSAALVGRIVRVIYENDRIYIKDKTDSIKIFDNDGKFLRNFGRRGRGPQEYLFPENIYVSPHNGNLIINSTGGHVFKYDSTGKFISKFVPSKKQKIGIDDPLWLDDTTYVAAIRFYNDKPKFSAVVYDSLGEVKFLIPIAKLPAYQIFSELKPTALLGPGGKRTYQNKESKVKILISPDVPFLLRYKDKIRLVYESNDSVLSIGANLLVDTPYIFNFGKFRNYSMDRSSISATKGKHISLMGRDEIMETDNFIFLHVALRDYAHEPYDKISANGKRTYALNDSYAIFKKKTGEFSFLNQTEMRVLGFRENLLGGPPFWPAYVSYDNSLVMVVSAASLIEYTRTHTVSPKLAEIVKKLNENDNPVVVIAK